MLKDEAQIERDKDDAELLNAGNAEAASLSAELAGEIRAMRTNSSVEFARRQLHILLDFYWDVGPIRDIILEELGEQDALIPHEFRMRDEKPDQREALKNSATDNSCPELLVSQAVVKTLNSEDELTWKEYRHILWALRRTGWKSEYVNGWEKRFGQGSSKMVEELLRALDQKNLNRISSRVVIDTLLSLTHLTRNQIKEKILALRELQ